MELLTGKVVRVYPAGRFVVIAFPPAQMPPLNHQLDVYRAGVKVGEVKISPPQREDMSVADVMTGQVQVGDQVRDR